MAITKRPLPRVPPPAAGTKSISSPMATKEDMLQASKAVHDKIQHDLDGRFKSLGDDLLLSIGKALEGRLDKRLDGEFEKRLAVELDARTKALGEVYAKRLEALEDAHTKRLADLDAHYKRLEQARDEVHRREVGFLKEAFRAGLEQIRSFVQGLQLPAPVVHLSAPDLHPVFNVDLPKLSPTIQMAVPDGCLTVVAEVRMPELPVEVKMPALPAPVVHFSTPPMKKTHFYDDHNRPFQTIEEPIAAGKPEE